MKLTEQLSTEDYHGKHILVTGSSGYLANNLIEFLSDIPCKITRVSKTGEILSLINGKSEITDIITDISDEHTWQQILPGVDIVFHFAAQTSISKANENPIYDRNQNVLPLLSLLETCRKYQHHPLILLSSTVAIYGLPENLPVNECFPNQPLSMYEMHKLHCEQYLNYYIFHGYVRGASLRLANVYGPGVKVAAGERGILNKMVKRAIHGEALTIYGDGDFYRDYVYIDDVSKAFLTAGLMPDVMNAKTFIIANGEAYTVKEAIHKIAEIVTKKLGKSIEISHVALPQSANILDTRNFKGNITAFCQATGWQPCVNFEQGIDNTIRALI
ncbi:MAG: hypothetical protein CMF49_04830 [Legionellales bacterium]|nr:hypothetical protein [Legionellales bacterium]|tara:strand:- start:302 stop:1291 length:990 start_codon:yes stop_codon:yes gene_type:complete